MNIFVVGDGNIVKIDREAVNQVVRTRNEPRNVWTITALADDALSADADSTSAAQPRHLTLLGKHGTAMDIRGRWYVRLEGEGGVLNPLELAPGITVQDDQSYSFDGAWEGRSYHIRAAHLT